jgi:hypothetical protein
MQLERKTRRRKPDESLQHDFFLHGGEQPRGNGESFCRCLVAGTWREHQVGVAVPILKCGGQGH